ncbi:MAG: hypothetical protein LBR40_02705 [Bacilli bacterium]|jgi:hypothetical protein|nr:hypothetical protein [Bacilli bacterium]
MDIKSFKLITIIRIIILLVVGILSIYYLGYLNNNLIYSGSTTTSTLVIIKSLKVILPIVLTIVLDSRICNLFVIRKEIVVIYVIWLLLAIILLIPYYNFAYQIQTSLSNFGPYILFVLTGILNIIVGIIFRKVYSE